MNDDYILAIVKGYDYSQSLMSVTAVIDDFKWKMGIEL